MTANRLLVTLGSPKGEVNCDVCVIGAGFTGLSAALELAQQGLSVVILEKNTVASSASGKNGGHIQRGLGKTPGWLTEHYGAADARFMCNISLEGIGLLLERIARHEIKCDLKFGHLTAATRPRHITELQQEIREWEALGHKDLEWLGTDDTQAIVPTPQYIGGLFDPKAGHFHPLNYALGLAHAVQKAGGLIFENTAATRIQTTGKQPRVYTADGHVNARFVIVAGATRLQGMETAARRTITVTAHMIATEPLGERRTAQVLTRDIAVADANFIMNYYRLSADNRLLFGGNCNYSDRDYAGEDMRLRRRMSSLFPALAMARIDHCWHGPLELTLNRMPHLGRISPEVYFAHGFGGHGVVMTNMAGKVIAEAVAGQAGRFDVFDRVKHAPFPGGSVVKRPLFMLGALWYQLRDML